MNFKVFPATLTKDGQKVPLIKSWYDLASNDPNQINQWVMQFGSRISFWGLPTGKTNGIVALDIDVKKANGWQSLRDLGYMLPNTLRQDTPSGGSHFFFKADPNKHYGNSVNSKLALDVRGDKGWVAFYGLTNNEPLADCPEWLTKLAPAKDPSLVQAGEGAPGMTPQVAGSILTQCLDDVRNAPAGESNDILNRASYRVGQVVASGSLNKDVAFIELFKAAKDRGKPDYEAKATIESGLNGGLKSPLSSPFPTEPIISVQLPTVPTVERWTPDPMTRDDLLNTSKLRKPQLFQDWSTEDISIVTADGGTGKTTLQLYEAICLALGDRFLGFNNLQQGKTLYITGEDTAGKLAAMVGAILNQMGLLDGNNEDKVQTVLDSVIIKKDSDLCLITKDKMGFLHPNTQATDKILQAVAEIKPKMIVFDPISSFWGSESALNDMNKAVTRFMSHLVDVSGACVVMINHMGKSSSSSKDVTQFAGRGGSGLPSNSRVSRNLIALKAEEFFEKTGTELHESNSAMLCVINKFSDGSPLYAVPFIIVRDRWLFSRINLTAAKVKEMEKQSSDLERVFAYIKQEREKDRWPTQAVVIGHFMTCSDSLSQDRIKRAVTALMYSGHMGEKVKAIENPDLTIKEKALIIVDSDGAEK